MRLRSWWRSAGIEILRVVRLLRRLSESCRLWSFLERFVLVDGYNIFDIDHMLSKVISRGFGTFNIVNSVKGVKAALTAPVKHIKSFLEPSGNKHNPQTNTTEEAFDEVSQEWQVAPPLDLGFSRQQPVWPADLQLLGERPAHELRHCRQPPRDLHSWRTFQVRELHRSPERGRLRGPWAHVAYAQGRPTSKVLYLWPSLQVGSFKKWKFGWDGLLSP